MRRPHRSQRSGPSWVIDPLCAGGLINSVAKSLKRLPRFAQYLSFGTVSVSVMSEESRPERYVRSDTDRIFAGVCGGLGAYLGVDPTLVRVLWVIVTLFSAGIGFFAYLLLWLLAPTESEIEQGG